MRFVFVNEIFRSYLSHWKTQPYGRKYDSGRAEFFEIGR